MRPLTAFERVRSLVFDLDTAAVPAEVRHFAALLLLDTLGVAAASRDMEAAHIARETALDLYAARPGGPAARLLFDGREASVAGAAFGGVESSSYSTSTVVTSSIVTATEATLAAAASSKVPIKR